MNTIENEIKVAVVTANFKYDNTSTDQLNTSFNKVDNWDYFVFSNQNIQNTFPYQLKLLDISNFKNCIHATKHIKWLTHKYLPEYDIIIWMDSFIKMDSDNINNIKKYIINVYKNSNNPIVMRTQEFKCINDDILWCIKNKRINMEIANNIRNYLSKNNFNVYKKSKTYWSSAIIKNNKNSVLQEACENLFDLIVNIGFRDQHWLPYIFNKYNINCNLLPNNYFEGNRKSSEYNEKSHQYIDILDK